MNDRTAPYQPTPEQRDYLELKRTRSKIDALTRPGMFAAAASSNAENGTGDAATLARLESRRRFLEARLAVSRALETLTDDDGTSDEMGVPEEGSRLEAVLAAYANLYDVAPADLP